MSDPGPQAGRVTRERVPTRFGPLDVAVLRRPAGGWYACADTSHPLLRGLPGAVADSREDALGALLRMVEQTQDDTWTAPADRSCVPCAPPVRVRITLPQQTVLGFAVAQADAQVWAVWEQDGSTAGAWVPVGAVTQLWSGRPWRARGRGRDVTRDAG
jgi:hypothetical protein